MITGWGSGQSGQARLLALLLAAAVAWLGFLRGCGRGDEDPGPSGSEEPPSVLSAESGPRASASARAAPAAAPVPTRLAIRLTGVFLQRKPEWNLAAIEDSRRGTLFAVRAGDVIPGLLEVRAVEPERVVFINLARQLPEFSALETDPGLVTTTGGGPPWKGSRFPDVEPVGPGRYRVPRATVERELARIAHAASEARWTPAPEGPGFACGEIVPGSIFDRLGLKDGDLVLAIDREPLIAPGSALEKLARLETARRLELRLRRGRRALTIVYSID